MKKYIVFLLMLIIPGLVFASGEAEDDDQVEVTWWHHQSLEVPAGARFAALAEEYEQMHPNVTITVETMPHEEYVKQLPVAFASGTGPDMFGVSYRDVFRYYDAGTLAPISTAEAETMGYSSINDMVADWAPGALDPYKIDGQYFGLPWEYNIYAFGINTKHFEEAGLDPDTDYPRTWDEVHEVAQQLVQKNADGRITRPALSFPFQNSPAWYMLELQPAIRMYGGSILNEDETESLVNSEAGVKAMELIKERFEIGVADLGIANGHDNYPDAFATGEFSMGVIGNWGTSRWPKQFDVEIGEFRAVPWPTISAGDPPNISTTTWAWVVNSASSSRVQEEAWRFAQFVTADANAHLEATGDVMPRAGWSQTEAGQEYPQAEFWEEMGEYAIPLTGFKQFSEVGAPLQRAMQDILLNDADIQQRLDEVVEEINRNLND